MELDARGHLARAEVALERFYMKILRRLPMSTTRLICSIIILIGLSISILPALAAYPWDGEKHWTGVIDCDWSKSGNWSPPGVPGPDDYVAVMPSAAGPCITGNAQCSMMDLNPWDPTSFGGRDTIVTITEIALDVNFGAAIRINSGVDYDSAVGGRAIVNIYGSTVTTPNPANSTTLCGITIGGGASTYGNSYGILNMYGGLVSVPRIAIYYGDVNLYGGTLECTTDSNFVLSQSRPENRINVNGGTLKLKGNHAAELSNYITSGRIVCIRGGDLGTPVYDGSTWTTLSGTGNFNLAWGPSPEVDAVNVHYYHGTDTNSITLSWQPGDLAKQHDVYFGTSFADVTSATTSSAEYKGSRYDANGDPHNWTITGNFTIGASYYWRVDETNESNVLAQGLVWKFTTHDGKAYNPRPQNGQNGLKEPLTLSWTAGDWTQSTGGHRVYFGTDYSTISLAGTSTTQYYRGTVSTTSYPMSSLYPDWTLSPGTTYYWRVDEVNNTTVYKSPVWSFIPAPYINIDDFEDYNTTGDLNALGDPNIGWLTGYTVYRLNGSCSGLSAVPVSGNITLVRDSAGKHMNFTYIDEPSTYAFSEVNRPYIGGTVFTSSLLSPAPAAIRVDYIGTSTNAADPCYDRMYIALEDTAGNIAVKYNPDANAAKVGVWTQWYTAITDGNLASVNKAAVVGFHLGFGNRLGCMDNETGGNGNVMFDNIRLYAQTCNPAFAPSADFTGDCYVGFDDLMIMAQEWLNYNPPCSSLPCPVPLPLGADLNHDYIVDFKDFAILGQEWRVEVLWP